MWHKGSLGDLAAKAAGRGFSRFHVAHLVEVHRADPQRSLLGSGSEKKFDVVGAQVGFEVHGCVRRCDVRQDYLKGGTLTPGQARR